MIIKLLVFLLVLLIPFLQPPRVIATEYGEKDRIIFSFGTQSLGIKVGHDANDSYYTIDTKIASIEHLSGADIQSNGVMNPHEFELWAVGDFWVVGGTNRGMPFLIVGESFSTEGESPLFRFNVVLTTLLLLFLGFTWIKKLEMVSPH